jgi:hypothetical protein
MSETKRITVEECMSKAVECRDWAKRATDPAHRTMLEHMAGTWERICADLRRVDGGSLSDPTVS